MSNRDPFLVAAQALLEDGLEALAAPLRDAPDDAVNWRPGDAETNSIAVLATHVLHSTRSWLAIAVGAPLPERDRPSEFRTEAPNAAALIALLDEFGADCRRLLAEARDVDWAAIRQTHPRARSGAAEEATAAWALVHAFEHLREHVAHIALTRQLWDAKPSPSDSLQAR